jgi:hypothetical protein
MKASTDERSFDMRMSQISCKMKQSTHLEPTFQQSIFVVYYNILLDGLLVKNLIKCDLCLCKVVGMYNQYRPQLNLLHHWEYNPMSNFDNAHTVI